LSDSRTVVHEEPTADGRLVRISFKIENRALGERETMWAIHLSDSRYEIASIPLVVFGVSMGDVVRASHRKGQLEFSRVEKRGGHSTYRLMVSPEAIGPRFASRWERLSEIGCSLERASARFVAVDVPPRTDIYTAFNIIEDGQLAGVWLFEEGHCGHPVRTARGS
jgi:hypothetical protein